MKILHGPSGPTSSPSANEIDFRRAFESAPGLFLILAPDRNFTVLWASKAYLRATLTDPSIVGRGLFEVFPDVPEQVNVDEPTLRASLERVVATKSTDTMTAHRYSLRRHERAGVEFEERFWNLVNSPVLSGKGDLLYIFHTVEDTTARLRADRDLRATDILDSIGEGFFSLDREWRFTYLNREALRLLGRATQELIGQVIWDEYRLAGTEFESAYRSAMDQRQGSSLTAFYPEHDRWYEVHAYPARQGVSVYFRDVTERKRAEQERELLIEQSERQRRIYEAALSNTPDLVYVFNLQHRFVYANEALLKMWGRTREEALGRTCLELGYPDWHAAMHDREIEQVVATRQPIRGEVPFTGTQGRRIYDYIFVPVTSGNGDVVAVAGTTRDVTERQQAEQEIREQARRLSEADRAKDEFLATLSHELRNPLAPLRNSLFLLGRSTDAKSDDDTTTRVYEMMERQVNHLVRLVDDLLEVSRISRGTLTLRKERIEVATIVRNAVETSEPAIRAARHQLSVSLPDEPLWLEGDPVRLAQILANLLDNAAKYTRDGGHVVVDVQRAEDAAVISVADNGAGISEEALQRIFEMFSRGEHATGRGLGIGLALARRLTTMHGGTLEARSEGPGKGSVFTIRLPISAHQRPEHASPRTVHDTMPRERILVIDDNSDAAESLGQILRLLGAEVRVAAGGAEGVEIFESFMPSVVLLDIGMPKMDGYEVARTIRSRFADVPTHIVALTGWGQDNDRRRAREAGFDHHLVKPAEIGALQSLLASLRGADRQIAPMSTSAGMGAGS